MKKFSILMILFIVSFVMVSCQGNNKPKEYQVTFETFGGQYIESKIVAENETVSKPNDPKKAGHIFDMWYADENFAVEYTFTEKVTSNLKIYAKFLKELVISLEANEGTLSVDKLDVIEGREFTLPTPVAPKDYQFIGWYNENNQKFTDKTIVNNITLYAKYELDETEEPDYLTVSFDPLNGESIDDVTGLSSGDKILAPTNPVRDGYKFLGWVTAENGDVFWNFDDDSVTESITLYAKWEETQTIAYYEYIFQEQLSSSTYLTLGSSITDKYGTHDYEGITYESGYKINSSGKIVFTTEEANLILILLVGKRVDLGLPDTAVAVNGNVYPITQNFQKIEIPLTTVGEYTIARGSSSAKEFGIFFLGIYGQPEVAIHTVSFETGDGTDIQDVLVEDGENLQLPKEPTHPELDFVGWFLDVDKTIPFDSEQSITENLTLYAKWEALETFTVTVDGVDYFVKEGKKLGNLIPEEKIGEVFTGYLLENGDYFDLATPIIEDLVLTSHYRAANVYTLTYEVDGGTMLGGVEEVNYYENQIVILETPEKAGYIFNGWYKDERRTQLFKDTYLTDHTIVFARWIDPSLIDETLVTGSYFESIFATWYEPDLSSVSVEYRVSGTDIYYSVDAALIRKDGDLARVDVPGLKAGYYDLLITKSNGDEIYANDIYAEALDRSGYAHFNYTQGIGAYKDDGTLKDDAVVIYVTEENKNSIQVPGLPQIGLGWILNNAQYTKQGSTTYGMYQNSQTIAAFNRPIVFRLIGTITTPLGATGYDSLENGGSKGDNGHMLRMKDANNITIEGIGEDAVIYGWGIHFMAATVNRGIGFEVRNLTFDKYPEDAVGLEGVQEGNNLTVPVQRGWVHHTTFMQGYANPAAESDKTEGDGSLDIKRGLYFTVAYNRFEGAHKTNLVGASDSNLQFHLTYHHNLWRNNASRIPLARQANIHMYNNVFETTDDNKNETGYAQNTRANAYIFSEANYFFGTKDPAYVRSGAIKSFNDIKYSVYGLNGATAVKSREQLVSSGNKYENFDTNSEVFYYDALNNCSNVSHLTDAVTARAEVEVYAGSYRVYEEPNINRHRITNVAPTTITDSYQSAGGKINKGTPFLVFSLTTDAKFSMVGGEKVEPALVTIYGEVLLIGTGRVTLSPGTYVVESSISHGASKGSSQAKDSRVTNINIELDSGAARQGRIDAANNAIAALPQTIVYNAATKDLIDAALHAYAALKDESERAEITNKTKLDNAVSAYNQAGKIYIENLINAIGVVDENSLVAITKARSAYDEATAEIQQLVTNLHVLENAEVQFESFHVQGVQNLIDELALPTDINSSDRDNTSNLLAEYNIVKNAYEGLSASQKNEITNYEKITTGIAVLEAMLLPFSVADFINELVIEEITLANSQELVQNYNAYVDFSEAQKAILTQAQMDKIQEAWDTYQNLLSQTTIEFYQFNGNNSYFTEISANGVNVTGSYGDITITRGLKVESKTIITFTTRVDNAKVFIQLNKTTKADNVKVGPTGTKDDETYTANNYVIEITLGNAGTYMLTRGSSEGHIIYMTVTEGGN